MTALSTRAGMLSNSNAISQREHEFFLGISRLFSEEWDGYKRAPEIDELVELLLNREDDSLWNELEAPLSTMTKEGEAGLHERLFKAAEDVLKEYAVSGGFRPPKKQRTPINAEQG